LAAGTGDYTATDGINAWNDEAKDYDPNNPTYSHFTQVVWKATKEVGCAIVTCPGGSIFAASFGVRAISPAFARLSDLWVSYRPLNSLRASITPPAMLSVNSSMLPVPIQPRAKAYVELFPFFHSQNVQA